MKVIETEEDRFGVPVFIFPKSATPSEIHEWLFNHYQGYKFAVIFDETHDEYEDFGRTYVYFLDEALGEAAEYAGVKVVKT